MRSVALKGEDPTLPRRRDILRDGDSTKDHPFPKSIPHWGAEIDGAKEEGGQSLKREEKSNVISDLHEHMGKAKVAILTRFSGLNVEKITQLRQELRRAEVEYRVVKNTLFRRAIQGTEKENFKPQVDGPIAVAWSETDPVAPARVLAKFAKDWPELQILVASSEGKLWGPAQIQEWVSLPTLDELRGKILGLLQAPASKLARLLVMPGTQLAQVFHLRGQAME